MLDNHKPHISKLPSFKFGNIEQGTNSNIAISIPIFYSAVDTNILAFDMGHIKNFHTKAAAWTVLSLIYNTDLYDNGVPIYFHVEDKIFKSVSETLRKFNVPETMIRKISCKESDRKINNVQFGKKYMCLLDNEIDTDAWLISDSDSFVCKRNGKMQWYQKLVSKNIMSKVCTFKRNVTDFYKNSIDLWLFNLCLSVGIKEKIETNNLNRLNAIEKECFQTVNLEYNVPNPISLDTFQRVSTATGWVKIPTNNPIVDYIREHYMNCYFDEHLLSMWDMQHNNDNILDIQSYLDVKDYFRMDHYADSDPSDDHDGYVLHAYSSIYIDTIPDIDKYWHRFFSDLSNNFYRYSNISIAAKPEPNV